MTTRSCPDWPDLMELAPDLQFMHYTVAEAQLPADALMKIPEVRMGDIEICADLDHHVFHAPHTDARVVDALRETHWFELREWRTRGPGSDRSKSGPGSDRSKSGPAPPGHDDFDRETF